LAGIIYCNSKRVTLGSSDGKVYCYGFTAPTGSILINNGAASTSSASVTLSLTYVDATSGVSAVRHRNDGAWDTEVWESATTSKSLTLTSNDDTQNEHKHNFSFFLNFINSVGLFHSLKN
jgi:hypothetical protein